MTEVRNMLSKYDLDVFLLSVPVLKEVLAVLEFVSHSFLAVLE